MFTSSAHASAPFLYKYVLVAAVNDRLFSLTVFRQSNALHYKKHTHIFLIYSIPSPYP